MPTSEERKKSGVYVFTPGHIATSEKYVKIMKTVLKMNFES
jgi:hypothetical protein